ncbi:MAG: hypothetical protein HXY43_20155 [Fischerella sp.]|jgi:hypothetical protein|uniref:hypothetical protein n=1 Tax=Fischerella sp. TaxID=1191 RepID=UPI0017977D2C|nr:hypothetical protein [Fischerella sp.]NWF61495.1 hypothetical protein [Fischerella sp.]
MSDRRYPPAYLRYLKARLWNLAQPGFWGTAIFLSVVGLVIKEYWTHPDLFHFGQKKQVAAQKPANSSLSAEDQAIAADIDNLPVLFYDFDRGTLPSKVSNSKNTQANNSQAFLDNVSKQQTAATEAYLINSLKQVNSAPISKLENPFVAQAENLLQLKDFQNESKFLGVNGLTPSSAQIDTAQSSTNVGMGLTNQIDSTQSTVVVSPLQTALNQSTNQSLSIGNGVTSIQTNPLGRSPSNTGLNGDAIAPVTNGMGYTQPTVTNLAQNSTSIPNQNLAPHPANIPNQFPNISTNLSDTQAIPSVQSGTSAVAPITQTPTQGAITPSNPGVNSNSGNPSGLQQYNSFSPSQFPGPYTGGKQINGISYP